jgi:hypothetical protein
MRTLILWLLVAAGTTISTPAAHAATGPCYPRAGTVNINTVQSGGSGEEPALITLAGAGSMTCSKFTGYHTLQVSLQRDGVEVASSTDTRVCNIVTSRYACTLGATTYAECIPGLWRVVVHGDGVEVDGAPVYEDCQEVRGAP